MGQVRNEYTKQSKVFKYSSEEGKVMMKFRFCLINKLKF